MQFSFPDITQASKVHLNNCNDDSNKTLQPVVDLGKTTDIAKQPNSSVVPAL